MEGLKAEAASTPVGSGGMDSTSSSDNRMCITIRDGEGKWMQLGWWWFYIFIYIYMCVCVCPYMIHRSGNDVSCEKNYENEKAHVQLL